jgi:hypothetical protein
MSVIPSRWAVENLRFDELGQSAICGLSSGGSEIVMGTRANILVDHAVPDDLDRPAVIARLAPTLSATIAVRDYWNSTEPEYPRDLSDRWTASPQAAPPHEKWVLYDGPGGFFIKFGPKIANVRASARWRGFLSIAAICRVHLPAFRSIALALGASQIAYLPDDDALTLDALTDGASLDDCIAEMKRKWGPPQESVESIAREIVEATDHRVPMVWFLEDIIKPPLVVR